MAKVKQPKWKKALGTEGAISVKSGAYPVKGTGIGGRKVRGEVSKSNTGTRKRSDGVIITRTGPNKYPKMTKEQKSNIGKEQLQIMKTQKLLSKKTPKMKVTKAKRPIITHKQAVVASVAAGVAGAAVATRKKKPSTWSDRNPTTGVTSSFDHTSQQWIKNK